MRNSRNILVLALVMGAMTSCGLKKQGDIQAPNNKIHDAAEDGDQAKVKQLLAAKPELLNARGAGYSTPLLCAARMNRKEVTSLLLAEKADVNAKDRKGRTPLHWAAMNGSKDVAKLLLDNGADVGARTLSSSMTPLHMARGKEMIELLLANKADINAKDYVDRTPLHLEAEREANEAKERAEVLLAHKANVNARDYWNRTPLDIAVEKKHTEIAALLRQHGGKLRDDIGWYPFSRQYREIQMVVAAAVLLLWIIAVAGRLLFKLVVR